MINLLYLLILFFTSSAIYAKDPHEAYNRDVENFNKSVDETFLKPAAQTYVDITPSPARSAISNFVNNLIEPVTIVNDLLQAKGTQGVEDTARFIFNSTFGLLGLIDIATPMGLVKHNEDFGQTFAVWGWRDSNYLNLPLLGPSTARDAVGTPISLTMTNFGIPFTIARLLSTRESLLALDPMIENASDRYLFVRDAYLQKREYDINDGTTNHKSKFDQFDFSE